MRKLVFIHFLLLHFGAFSQFFGGISDGSSDTSLVANNCPIAPNNAFAGGQNDGAGLGLLANNTCQILDINPFRGGHDDGHSVGILQASVCTILDINPFRGGSEDGHSVGILQPSTCVVLDINPFRGSMEDGHSVGVLQPSNCTFLDINPFRGSIEDGAHVGILSNSFCDNIGINPFIGAAQDGFSIEDSLVYNPLDCATPLPVTLASFSADCDGLLPTLIWKTQSEVNNELFFIEKSMDGINYTMVHTELGAGFSTYPITYSWTDSVIALEPIYYKLFQKDFNGERREIGITVSNCKIQDNNGLIVFPNPTINTFKIIGFGTTADLKIFNAWGELVYDEKNYSEGNDVNLEGKKGAYLGQITIDGTVKVFKIIVAY